MASISIRFRYAMSGANVCSAAVSECDNVRRRHQLSPNSYRGELYCPMNSATGQGLCLSTPHADKAFDANSL
eukprot:3766476-Rhodomonas_salina.2